MIENVQVKKFSHFLFSNFFFNFFVKFVKIKKLTIFSQSKITVIFMQKNKFLVAKIYAKIVL